MVEFQFLAGQFIILILSGIVDMPHLSLTCHTSDSHASPKQHMPHLKIVHMPHLSLTCLTSDSHASPKQHMPHLIIVDMPHLSVVCVENV